MIRNGSESLLNDSKVAEAYNALADYVMIYKENIVSFVPKGKNKYRILRDRNSAMEGFHGIVDIAIEQIDGKNVMTDVDIGELAKNIGVLYKNLYDLIYPFLVDYILKKNAVEVKKQYITRYSEKIKNLRKRIEAFQTDIAFYVGEVELLRGELDNTNKV